MTGSALRSRSLGTLSTMAVAIVILALSAQLVRVKREGARLRAAVRHATHAFVQGTPVPSLVVRDESGASRRLTDFCSATRQTLFVVTSVTCPACERVRSQWESVARESKGLRVVSVEVSGSDSQPSAPDTPNLMRMHAASGAASAALRIDLLPAALLADGACAVAAAGTGEPAVRSVIAESETVP